MSRFRLAGLAATLAIAAALVIVIAHTVRAPAFAEGPTGEASPGLSGPERALVESRVWLNTPPLRAQNLRGKAVLVNFWTYSCINSLRALPYVRAWAAKYKDQGLVVIGVHTPEFAFEKDVENVRRANGELGVAYPVVLDSDYRIWNAFGNEAWPAFYIIDARGHVRGRVLGEGDYDRSERLIQQVLSQGSAARQAAGLKPIVGVGPEAAADLADLRSEETYVGYARASHFASPEGISRDAPQLYTAPRSLRLGEESLTGQWTVGGEFAALNAAPGAIRFRFHARDLNLVLGASTLGQPIPFRVTVDGEKPGASHGWDVDAAGNGKLRYSRMYQLVRQAGPVADHTFQIEFLDPGARAYVFTFG